MGVFLFNGKQEKYPPSERSLIIFKNKENFFRVEASAHHSIQCESFDDPRGFLSRRHTKNSPQINSLRSLLKAADSKVAYTELNEYSDFEVGVGYCNDSPIGMTTETIPSAMSEHHHPHSQQLTRNSDSFFVRTNQIRFVASV